MRLENTDTVGRSLGVGTELMFSCFPFFLLRGFPAINSLLVTGEKKLITEIYSEESFPTCSDLQTD